MGVLVWESDPGIIGASVYNDAGNCERAIFAATNGVASSDLDCKLDGGSGGGEARVVVGVGRSNLDHSGRESFGFWVGLGDGFFGFVAGGVGIFVFKIS